MKRYFDESDYNLRGFTRDFNYIQEVLEELERRTDEAKQGKPRKRRKPFVLDGGDLPKAEEDED
ncbi:MAG TPA: hypothetical protein VHS80_04045 [Chthoniobacterales bacterium]|nr:hypothetical protein [Chthoniobacterales bacterium]